MLYLNVVTVRVDGVKPARFCSPVRVALGGHIDVAPGTGCTLDDDGKAVNITDSGASYAWVSMQEPTIEEAVAYAKEHIAAAVVKRVHEQLERITLADGQAEDKAVAMQRLSVTITLAHRLSNLCHVR